MTAKEHPAILIDLFFRTSVRSEYQELWTAHAQSSVIWTVNPDQNVRMLLRHIGAGLAADKNPRTLQMTFLYEGLHHQ